GSVSHEFVVPSDAGEDVVVQSTDSGYAANLEKAVANPKPPALPDPEGGEQPEEFATPGKKTIEEVAEFTGLPATSHIKTLLLVADEKPVMALLRGDHQLNDTKLEVALGGRAFRPAHPEEIRQWLG